jgi:hypothetical protein
MPVSPDAAAWMLKFVFVYLANTAVLCYSLTIICCCQVQDYIYWIISTENDHRHHHKFIKYWKRLRKEGKNMLGLPIKQNLCHFQHEFGCIALTWVRSNWSPTYILHLFHLEDTSLLFIFLSESVKVYFLPCIDTFSFAQEPRCLLFLNKCACSRRVHIEGHMNRFEFLLSWTIIPITIVLGLSCQKIISFAA